MKNRTIWASLLLAAIFLGACSFGSKEKVAEREFPVSEAGMEADNVQAGLVIDDGEEPASFSAQIDEDEKVLGLLTKVLDREGIDYEVESYDFGDLVKSIDGKENSAEKAWIYYVNGKTADVGAGDKAVNEGDVVEWKYIKPIY